MLHRRVDHVTFAVERTYPASPEQTFAAWADPEAKARWSDIVGELELDFRVGGRERHAGTTPDGRVYAFEGVYQDIVRPRRIIYTYEMLVDGTRISVSLATVEIGPEGDGTRLLYTEQGAFLDGLETRESREYGMGGLLDRLRDELVRSPGR
jgi:uncharacterized protein YndB with AHSA1/START domain